MRKKKYLPLYYKWMETGLIDGIGGLCNNFAHWNIVKQEWEYPDKIFKLMTPLDMPEETYWASDVDMYEPYEFGGLRQNIVLLMAAMNGEL